MTGSTLPTFEPSNLEPPPLPGRPIDPSELEAKFHQWRGIVDRMHAHTRFTPNDRLSWTPLTKPLAGCTVALVSTAGVHLNSQPPFDLMNEGGDWSFREIPRGASAADLAVSHSHYDTTDANADPNVVFPIDRYRAWLRAEVDREQAKPRPDAIKLQALGPQLKYLLELSSALEGPAHDGLVRVSDRVVRIRHWQEGVFI